MADDRLVFLLDNAVLLNWTDEQAERWVAHVKACGHTMRPLVVRIHASEEDVSNPEVLIRALRRNGDAFGVARSPEEAADYMLARALSRARRDDGG